MMTEFFLNNLSLIFLMASMQNKSFKNYSTNLTNKCSKNGNNSSAIRTFLIPLFLSHIFYHVEFRKKCFNLQILFGDDRMLHNVKNGKFWFHIGIDRDHLAHSILIKKV